MRDVDDAARPDCATGALFTDDEGAVLLVEPTFRSRWELPGGEVERGETPREACARAVSEQFGIDLALGRLLVVDWAPVVREEHIGFVFDGGELTPEQLDGVELVPDELCAWAFLPPEELFVMMEPRLVRRVTAALGARDADATSYLEHGVPADAP
ncbi:MAG: NUDIX hydrolase [Pseudonocardia sp.]|nr:NUDIX hydrolase [Pseudonocardia sp.]